MNPLYQRQMQQSQTNPLYQTQQTSPTPFYQKQQSQRSQNQQPNFKDFFTSMTPEEAKNQIEQMLNSGTLTQQQLEQAKEKAQMLASLFNIK